jgi:hypothetical protein
MHHALLSSIVHGATLDSLMARKRKGLQPNSNKGGNKKPKKGSQHNGHKKKSKQPTTADDGIDVIIWAKASMKLPTRIFLQCLALHVASAVSLGSPEIHGDSGEEIAYFQDENGPIATLELFHQHAKRDKTIAGSMNILSTINGHFVLDPLQVTALLNAYTRKNPFVVDSDAKSIAPLLFVFGEEGKEELLKRGRPAMVESILNVSNHLLSMVQDNDKSMPFKTWKRKWRFAVNDRGIGFEMKPQDAAEAAGIQWNPRHKIFSM